MQQLKLTDCQPAPDWGPRGFLLQANVALAATDSGGITQITHEGKVLWRALATIGAFTEIVVPASTTEQGLFEAIVVVQERAMELDLTADKLLGILHHNLPLGPSKVEIEVCGDSLVVTSNLSLRTDTEHFRLTNMRGGLTFDTTGKKVTLTFDRSYPIETRKVTVDRLRNELTY